MLLAFYQDPGGFRELWGPGRKHFHLSWYLSGAAVTNYSQKSSWWDLFTVNGVLYTYIHICIYTHILHGLWVYICTYILHMRASVL